MPYIDKPIDRNQVMITTFDELIAPDSTARIIAKVFYKRTLTTQYIFVKIDI